MKRWLGLAFLVAVQIMVCASLAAAMVIPLAEEGQKHWQAPEKSPVISEYGDLTRVDFIHYAKPNDAARPPKTDLGYKLTGVKWLWQEDYVVNLSSAPAAGESLSAVMASITASSDTWDAETSVALFGAVAEDNAAHYGVYDNKNAVEFGAYADSNVIAVTSYWFNRRSKAILEFDMLFNTAYFAWSTNGAPEAMDLQNIATHEFGHAVGLDDIYNAKYSDVTMYGYASAGETEKRSLAPPDINGLQKIYGI